MKRTRVEDISANITLTDVRRAIALIDNVPDSTMYMNMYSLFFHFTVQLDTTPARLHGAWHALAAHGMVHAGVTLRCIYGMFRYPIQYWYDKNPAFSLHLDLEPLRRRRLLLLARTLAPIEPRLPALVLVRIAHATVQHESDPSAVSQYAPWTWNDSYGAYANLFERGGDHGAWMAAYRACGCECECKHVVDHTGRELTRDELHAGWRHD